MEETANQHLDPSEAFKEVMKLIKTYPLSESDYQKGLSYLDALEQNEITVSAEELGLDPSELNEEANEMKESFNNDILPVLTYLGKFTYDMDPRIRDDSVKRDYLVGVKCFILTSRRYLDCLKT